MVYKSTTAVPRSEGEIEVLHTANFSDADTFPKEFWVPPPGKRIVIDDFLLHVGESSAKRAIFELQIFKDSAWKTIGMVGQVGDGFAVTDHSFFGKVVSDIGDGTAKRMRLNKASATNSTGFLLGVVVVGREA